VPGPDPIARFASDVADGRPVDWARAQSQVGEADLETLEQLQILAAIAGAHDHDSVGATADSAATAGPDGRAAASLFDWGPLRVLEHLGSGSFGDVFRAWDTTLDRDVALKLLKRGRPAAVRADAIIREGQMLAKVRHPNVMAVYGAATVDGQVGIWGELLTGRTLAEIVVDDGPMAPQEASLYCDAVCRALTAVHRTGLLHRDIKAQNVMREVGGRIVLMDFGLGREAHAMPAAADGPELAGTPLYLAPELFAGRAASARSDVYSVGVLLFHLVTGSFPVLGDSLDGIARAHAEGHARRLHDLRADLPRDFVEVVERALAGDPAARFESAGALQAALARIAYGAVSGAGVTSRKSMAVGAAAASGVLGLAFALAVWQWPGPDPPSPLVLSLTPPPGLTFTQGARNVPAISPDGERIAFVATDAAGVTQLWIRRVGATEASPIAQSLGASSPFWAPDSQSVGFFSGAGLHRVSVSGARSEVLLRLWENRGAAWGPDGQLLLAEGPGTGLSRLPATGGTLTPVTRVERERGEHAHMWPQLLPDGRFIFFVLSDQERVRGVYLGSSDGSKQRLIATDSSAVYAAGSLYFVRDSTLFAQPVDLERGIMTAAPVTIASQVGVTYNLRSAITVSETGTVIYAPRARDYRRLVWYDLQGRELATVAPPEKYRNPALSRDGRYLAVEWYDALSEIRVFDLERGGWRSLNVGFRAHLPVFGPRYELAFALSPNGSADLYSADLDGGSLPRAIVPSAHDVEPTDWSPDGDRLLYAIVGDRGFKDVWTVKRGAPAGTALIDGPHHEVQGRFSPDSRAVAFVSNRSGRSEVYVRRPWDSGKPEPISTAGGSDPVWRSDTELLYLDPSGTLMSARVPGSPGFRPAPPQRLFRSTVDTPGASRNHYVLHPDKQRVLFAAPVSDAGATAFVVLLHWHSASLGK
jgi:eukaryotic-like serine/threonine-protein kinase